MAATVEPASEVVVVVVVVVVMVVVVVVVVVEITLSTHHSSLVPLSAQLGRYHFGLPARGDGV